MTIRLASFTLFFALAIGMPLAARSADEDNVALPDGVSTEAWASIRSAYEAGRHAAVATDGGYEARNPGQALTASFDHQGATMTADRGDWTWGLELTSWGFEGALQEAREAAELSATGARVTYRWSPGLSEWWINESRGFEHGFTVHERPDAANGSTGTPLQFALDVRGDLRAQISSDGRSVRFVDDNTGSIQLQYSGLVAVDADGTSLEAWIEANGDGLVLFVCESAARYPLTIDQLAGRTAMPRESTAISSTTPLSDQERRMYSFVPRQAGRSRRTSRRRIRMLATISETRSPSLATRSSSERWAKTAMRPGSTAIRRTMAPARRVPRTCSFAAMVSGRRRPISRRRTPTPPTGSAGQPPSRGTPWSSAPGGRAALPPE